jgi:hypothetical protein
LLGKISVVDLFKHFEVDILIRVENQFFEQLIYRIWRGIRINVPILSCFSKVKNTITLILIDAFTTNIRDYSF